MKKILFLGLLVSSMSFGSGKISLRPQYHLDASHEGLKALGATAGLGIYERFFSRFAANIWLGMGYRPSVIAQDVNPENGTVWFSTNTELDVDMSNKLVISPGLQLRYTPSFGGVHDRSVSLKASYKLW